MAFLTSTAIHRHARSVIFPPHLHLSRPSALIHRAPATRSAALHHLHRQSPICQPPTMAAAAGSGNNSNPPATTSVDTTPTTSMTLPAFLTAASDLGTIRFITISPHGAVLETIGRFDYAVTPFSIPGKGDYITIASIDKTFECHINTSKVSTITLSTEPAKIGHHHLHVIRLRNAHNDIVLSCLLQYDPSQGPGHYLHGAVDAFNALRSKLGDVVKVIPADD